MIDSSVPQEGADLEWGRDPAYESVLQSPGPAGLAEVDGSPAAFRQVATKDGNANRWIVVATPQVPPTLLDNIGAASLGMLLAALVLLGVGVATFRSARVSFESRPPPTDSPGCGTAASSWPTWRKPLAGRIGISPCC